MGYECRVSQESTKNYSEKEKSSVSDFSAKKLKKASPNGSAKTSLDISQTSSLDMALKNFFAQKNGENQVEETNDVYAKEEIFSKFENMSDDLDSVLCLPYENDGIYENS